MANVDIRSVRKAFETVQVLHGVNVDIEDGEFVVLVGPSGCGKSTLLRIIAGLERITTGEIRIGSRVVNDVPPKERDIAMVFQNYALYPHMTVFDNMAFSLSLVRSPAAAIRAEVSRAAAILGLGNLLDRYPRQLSPSPREEDRDRGSSARADRIRDSSDRSRRQDAAGLHVSRQIERAAG